MADLLRASPLEVAGVEELLAALQASVDSARYWQEPDGEDVLTTTRDVRAALNQLAQMISEHSLARWWTAPVDIDSQWFVLFDGMKAPVAGDVEGALERWRTEIGAEEERAQRERPIDPAASWGGSWWSIPPRSLLSTTRRLSAGKVANDVGIPTDLGPAGLHLVEDAMFDHAAVHRALVPEGLRIYEIDGPAALAELCAQYPFEVTASRRHDWFRTTGVDRRWVIPDWQRVAADFDGVHLTVAGYLETAGRDIRVTDDLSTVLAGWDPDQTWWLTDRVRLDDGADAIVERWSRINDGWCRD
ncbi:hypothetical protein [Marisediminicola sp. LYQ134]|uniref:hypothetical protein n=1 Tax=Marisediminicola sp. LYQ134 TaxID=3391061 RepID=UPI0039831A07